MNKSDILCLSLASLVMMGLAGCSEDIYDGPYMPSLESHYLYVWPRDFTFENGVETASGDIMSENAWSFTDVPSWLSVSPESGESNSAFSLTSAVNETGSVRTSVFYLSVNTGDWQQNKVITASQNRATPTFSFADLKSTDLYVDAKSQSITVEVKTNVEDLVPRVSLTPGTDDWMTASYENNLLTITISANNGAYLRRGTVDLRSASSATGGALHITQYEPNLSFNELTSLSFDADGGSQTVDMSSDLSWYAIADESWLEVSPAEGVAGDNQITITALPSYDADKRTGKALFYYKEKEADAGSITVYQTGRRITVSPSAVTLSARENSSESVTIDSNIGWVVSSCPDWLSSDKENGDAGTSTVILTAAENTSMNSRFGYVKFTDSKSGGIKSQVSVTQNGMDFSDQSVLEFDWRQSSLPLDIPYSEAWNAAVSAGWISLSEYAGTGKSSVSVTVSRNDSEETRTGNIAFSCEGKTTEVAVVQSGQYIRIDNTSGEFNAMGGSLILNVETSVNTSYDIEYDGSEKDWISVGQTSQTEIPINVAYNPSHTDRSATFILYPMEDEVSETYAQGVKLAIRQTGRRLSCETSRIEMTASGGTSKVYRISADGKYLIEKASGDNWYNLVSDQTTDTFYVVATENTTGAERSGQIILSLTDLPAGETHNLTIEMFQYKPGVNISFENFEEETVW